MGPKMISSDTPVKYHENMPAKLIVGSVYNFKFTPEPGHNFSRPLMVNGWSQTTDNDFSYLYELENKEEQSKREKELLEKVRVLEQNLRAHTDILSQIHATSARTSALLEQQHQPQNRPNPIQAQTVEKTSQLSPIEICSHTSTNSSVMYPLYPMGSSPMENVTYTILAEGAGDVQGEPIEIELSEDDGVLNLNSSANSDRLEIYMAREEVEIKTESMPTTTDLVSHSTSTAMIKHNLTKRNNMVIYRNASQESVLTPSNENANSNSFTHHQALLPKRRSGSCLLKSVKRKYQQSNRTDTSSGVVGLEKKIDTDHIMVSIGPNNTQISAKIYEGMTWNSASIATRKLLMASFERNTLATHSMTGKPSPAFKDQNKPLKEMLDPLVIQDIIFAVTRKCNVSEKEVRNAITTKCADENKMMKLQMNKRPSMRVINKDQ